VQRRSTEIVGDNWAMLPGAAAFLDPLHSAGNAHTLCGIERLMPILSETPKQRANLLRQYERTTFHELELLDKLIHGCYKCFDDFDLFSHFAMLYFAGADFTERQRRAGKNASFLNSGDTAFCEMVEGLYARVIDPTILANTIGMGIRGAIEPWNLVGLCDPAKQNMYDYA
jgi:FADH2 O2-dependent halogenase